VLVTHHVEEIPAGFTHGLLMADGCVVASGRLEDVLTETNLARCFGVEVSLAQTRGRWSARVDGGTR
jgi:iron complex transport system ATP-binding protein